MRWLVFLIFSCRLFGGSFEKVTPSTPEEILSLTSNLLIGGYVSAPSGQLFLSETDLHIKGAQDLFLKRTYVAPQIFGRYEDKGTGFSRTLDPFGNIKREEWANGLWVETDYDDWDRPIERRLPDHSRITYQYEGPFLKKITRFDRNQREQYSHLYEEHDANGNPLVEQGAFTTLSTYDLSGRKTGQKTPYFEEAIEYDPAGNLIRKGKTAYTYDLLSQMTSESEQFKATYDSRYNLQELDGQSLGVNALNQIEGLSYDLNGNLLKPGFVYDAFDQLIEASGESYSYDALGRRIQKGDIAFLYFDEEEVASFKNGVLQELKIAGTEPVAIEIEGNAYAAIADVQGTIRLLIDPTTLEVHAQNSCDAFGAGLTDTIPYAYLGKRCDPQTGLVYFGKRYYDPSLRRWLTPDPLGPVNHSNLYQYLFNNPYAYRDLNGEFAFAIPLIFWGAELALPVLSTCVTAIVYGSAAGAVAYGGYKLVEAMNEKNYYSGDFTSAIGIYKDSGGKRSSDEPDAPPVQGDQIVGDGSTSPGSGFNEWKGKGPPSSGKGSWVKGSGNSIESLHPDLNHPEHGPHWDYVGPKFPQGARIYPNGTWEPK